jgi:selenocysteine-specific elongation factor
MIVATAGHIDHGKTALVKRLTDVDTDRLPEEKARGISIDLGFAYLPGPGGELIGFVDVPGHERFIRNMLAGVCGIDFALLIVAADDGIMPQTVEHLQILDLLGVKRGAAVITKIDRVDGARVKQVQENVTALLAPTSLAGIPCLAVSSVTGEGIAAVGALLQQQAAAQGEHAGTSQHFRFAIDRAFTIAGSGTVVTGTVFSGAVAVGDRLNLSPAGTPARVRGIQIRGESAERARAGQRCAINLAGADLESVRRGDWLLAEPIHRPTDRIDARVKVLPSEAQAIAHWTPVHLHLATADVTARVAMRRGEALAPGASAIVRLVLDRPIGALHGDRFILRDQSARRTLGGGVVIDPLPPASRRASKVRAAELAAMEQPPAQAISALLEATGAGVDLNRFEQAYNLTPEAATELYRTAELVVIGKESRVGISRTLHDTLREKIVAGVTDFHRRTPQATGIEIEALRSALALQLPPDVFGSLLRGLNDERRIDVSGSHARLPGHDATSNPEDARLWQALQPALETAGFAQPAMRDLATQLKIKEALVRDLLYRKAKAGDVFKVGAERFYLRQTLATLAALARQTAQSTANGQFTAAQYRDATGVGRGLAIEILEVLDRLAITQRLGDARKMRKEFEPILGPAGPLPKPPARPAASPKSPGPARQPARRRF